MTSLISPSAYLGPVTREQHKAAKFREQKKRHAASVIQKAYRAQKLQSHATCIKGDIDMCMICWEKYLPCFPEHGKEVFRRRLIASQIQKGSIVISKCHHIFDRTCIQTYLKESKENRCPSCRAESFLPYFRPGASKEDLLFQAINNQQIEKVKDLIADGVSLGAQNNEGETPLHVAIRSSNLALVQALILAGAPLETKNNRADTPLSTAAKYGSAEMIQMLIDAGANLLCRDWLDQTLLHNAVRFNTLDAIQTLIHAQAPVDISGPGYMTPLHYAARGKNLEILEALVLAGANINALDSDHQSPLHHAVQAKNGPAVQALIDFGAHIALQDQENKTPMDWAKLQKSSEVIQILEKYPQKARFWDFMHQVGQLFGFHS